MIENTFMVSLLVLDLTRPMSAKDGTAGRRLPQRPAQLHLGPNGGGNHSIASAKKVNEILQKADVGGLASVQNALKKMGAQMTKGISNEQPRNL